jgi:predicted enzyme related to lactoylglutathione lyase
LNFGKIRLQGLLAWVTIAVVLSVLPGTPQADDSADMAKVGPLLRTTIMVRDMDAALAVFQDLLGLTVFRDVELAGEAVSTLVGHENASGRIVILQSGESVVGNVAVMSYADEDAGEAPPYNASLDTGEVALIMETKDIDGIYAAAKAAGYTVFTPPMVIFERPGWAIQSREMMFVGPEGVIINLIQPGVKKSSADEQPQ